MICPTIANPHVVPDMATMEWTVRNEGQESALIGDLGHRWSGARMFSVEEKTAYVGLHHMDCVIRGLRAQSTPCDECP